MDKKRMLIPGVHASIPEWHGEGGDEYGEVVSVGRPLP